MKVKDLIKEFEKLDGEKEIFKSDTEYICMELKEVITLKEYYENCENDAYVIY